MENASEAIIMAGSVMLLLIALTISISSLANIKTQTQSILDSRDQVDMSQDQNGDYINYITTDSSEDVRSVGVASEDVRSVGVDGIISELRRMKKENFTIYIVPIDRYFEFNNQQFKNAKLVYESTKEQKYIDAKNITTTLIPLRKKIIELSMAVEKQTVLFYYTPPPQGQPPIQQPPIQEVNRVFVRELYDKFKNATFKEYIGIYQEKTAEGVSEPNKETKKIITFVQN